MTRPIRITAKDDHVVEVAWVPLAEAGARIVVGVVREPLLAYLRGSLTQRYAGFHDAGVTIEWPADSDANRPRGKLVARENTRCRADRLIALGR